MGVSGCVVREGPFPANADQARKTEFGQVLAHRGRAGVDELCQAVDRGLALEQCHEDLDAVLVGEHAEGVCRDLHVCVVGHLEIRDLIVHEHIIDLRICMDTQILR